MVQWQSTVARTGVICLTFGVLAGCFGQSGPTFVPIGGMVLPIFHPGRNGPFTATAYNARGVDRLRAQNLYGALEDFREAVKQEPDNAIFQENFGWTLVLLKDYEAGLNTLNKAVTLNPGNPDTLWKRGAARHRMQDYAGAISDYTEALTLDPASKTARGNRASAKASLRQWKEAEEDYTLAITNAANPDLYADRAEVRLNLGDMLGAHLDYSQAIEGNPKVAAWHIRRSQIRLKLSDPTGALRDLDEAIELRPSDAMFYWWRAKLRHALRNHVGAQQDFESALRLDPSLRDKVHSSGDQL